MPWKTGGAQSHLPTRDHQNINFNPYLKGFLWGF